LLDIQNFREKKHKIGVEETGIQFIKQKTIEKTTSFIPNRRPKTHYTGRLKSKTRKQVRRLQRNDPEKHYLKKKTHDPE
jgi:hypothetical protein